jgi:hypothetical protein
MTARLYARLARLQPRRLDRMVVHRDPGDSDLDVEVKALEIGRPVAVMPRPCRSAKEWVLTYGPIGGAA